MSMLRTVMACVLQLWVVSQLHGQDPSADLHYDVALSSLQELQPRLTASPHDPRLLAQAERLYINLCMIGDADDNGSYGPWLDYAQAIRASRHDLLAATPAGDFDITVDDCWVDVMAGDAVGVMAVLTHFQSQSSSPEWQSLCAMATHDPGRVPTATTPDQIFARRSAALDSGNTTQVLSLAATDACEPFTRGWDFLRAGDVQYAPAMVREIIGSIAAMCASKELDDGHARALAQQLLTAVGQGPDPSRSREQLVTQAISAAAEMDPTQHQLLIAADAVCSACMAKPRSWDRDHPLLLTLADLALWNHDRIYQAAMRSATCTGGITETFGKPLAQDAPDMVVARRLALHWDYNHFIPEDAQACATTIAKALASTTSLRDTSVTLAAGFLSEFYPDMVADSIRTLVSLRVTDSQARSNRVLLYDLALAAERDGLNAPLEPLVMAAVARDPFDAELHSLVAHYDPAARMVDWVRSPPTTTWTDATIDVAQLPWNHPTVATLFAIRWSGSMSLPSKGTYLLAIESDDGTRLAVGPAVANNGGFHAPTRRSVELAGGARYPLCCEFYQGEGGASCRLFWKPPGASDFSVVPAEALSHGADSQPGLLAEYVAYPTGKEFNLALTPSLAERAYAASLPYQSKLNSQLGVTLFDACFWDDCVPFLSCAEAITHAQWERWHLGNALMYCTHPDYPRAIQCFLGGGGIIPSGNRNLTSWVTNGLLKSGLEKPMLADFAWREDLPTELYIRLYLKLAAGDFAGMVADGKLMMGMQPRRRGLDLYDDEWNQVQVLLALFGRMQGEPPTDWNAMADSFHRHLTSSFYFSFFEWISGHASYQDALAKQTTPDGRDGLEYLHAIYLISIGEHAQAKLGLQHLIDTHPDWSYVPTAAAILRWYATQTPQQVLALPKAAAVVDLVKSGKNDF